MEPRRIRAGIGRRIAVLVSLAVLVAVITVSGLLTLHDANVTAKQKRAAIEGTAYVFASAVADHVVTQDAHAIRSVLRSVERVPGVVSAAVYDRQGGLIASLGQKAVLQSDMITGDPGIYEMMSKGTVPVSVNIIKSGGVEGTLVLVADISDLRASFLQTMTAVLLASILAAALGVVLSVPLQRRITTPLRKLARAMQDLRTSKDYSVTLEQGGTDETGILVENFNSLISDIRSRDQSLQKLAFFDTLTGLPNRAGFQRELALRLEKLSPDHTEKLTAILLNIDGFRGLNNAFGLAVGDAILAQVAATLKAEAPASSFIARLGGDEFGLIIPDHAAGSAALTTLAHIQAIYIQPASILGIDMHLTLTAGATSLPQDTTDVGDALRFMDLAANSARKQGTGRSIFFKVEMDEALRKETDLSQKLRSAIDNNELTLQFQPQQELASGQITGFEALLRWTHPTLGNIPPSLFIPVAERHGLVAAIGDWVLKQGCLQAREWIDQGNFPCTVAINVSPAQVLQSGFVRRVQDALAEAALPSELLCLELTESLFLGRSLAPVKAILDEVQQLGVSLALDDFGTGFSSLSYLAQLPFDKLKIDRSFVSASQESHKRTEILRSIIQMARSLGMTVVAEGAETQTELELLAELGADQVQGYVIARPLAAEQAIALANRVNAIAA